MLFYKKNPSTSFCLLLKRLRNASKFSDQISPIFAFSDPLRLRRIFYIGELNGEDSSKRRLHLPGQRHSLPDHRQHAPRTYLQYSILCSQGSYVAWHMSKLWKLVADGAPPPVMSVSSWSDSMVTDNAITMFAPPGVAFHCFICSKYTMAAKLPHTMWPAVPLQLYSL